MTIDTSYNNNDRGHYVINEPQHNVKFELYRSCLSAPRSGLVLLVPCMT